MKLEKAKLLAPEYPNKANKLVGGKASGILNWNDLLYSQFYKNYKTMLGNFWIPSEISMADDSKMWNKVNVLSVAEKDAYLKILALLAILDSVQPNYISKVKDYITEPSVKAILSIIEQQEVVHNQSYSYALSSIEKLDRQNISFEMARTEKMIYERNKYVIDVYEDFSDNPTLETLLRSLVSSVVLEGINFYSAFAFFYNLARNQKMVGTSTIISYINKDELTHAQFISMIIKIIMQENPEINDGGRFNQYCNDYFKKAAELEIEWANYILKDIEDIDKTEMTAYIKYRANKCLNMIGFSSIFKEVSENPMPWIRVFDDEHINDTKSDFFEQKSRSYTKVTEDNGFDEL